MTKDLPVSITEGGYKDARAVILESEALRVTLIPDWGAKMASLIHKPAGVEHLNQLPGKEFLKSTYGAPYVKGEFGGFDEMFPTITECYCVAGARGQRSHEQLRQVCQNAKLGNFRPYFDLRLR